MQPVMILGAALAKRLGLPFAASWVRRVRDLPELKSVYDYDERLRRLAGAHEVDDTKVKDRRILLFDDLLRSGATMNAITSALYDSGRARDVFALAVTCTRKNP